MLAELDEGIKSDLSSDEELQLFRDNIDKIYDPVIS